MELKIIYQDENLLVIDKPPKLIVFPEKPIKEETLVGLLLKQFPYLKTAGESPRYGIVHRLDKDTSGLLLVAKNDKSLSFLQSQFKNRKVVKKYIALVVGKLKECKGEIETLIGRSPKDRRKQRIFFDLEPKAKGKRKAVTEYRVLKHFYRSIAKARERQRQKSGKEKNYYTLVEVTIKTGRKHQIRAHFNYLGYPLAGDKLYFFKNQVSPKNLKRQFLHASFLKLKLLNGKEKEFKSEISKDLKEVVEKLNEEERTKN